MLNIEIWNKINASRDKNSDINIEEFKLFNNINNKLNELIGDDFNIISSWIGNGIDYNITTPATGLPERVGLLFFTLDKNFTVRCNEVTTDINNDSERNYIITIKMY